MSSWHETEIVYLHIGLRGCRLMLLIDVHHNKCLLASNLEQTLRTNRRATGNDLFEQIAAGIYANDSIFWTHKEDDWVIHDEWGCSNIAITGHCQNVNHAYYQFYSHFSIFKFIITLWLGHKGLINGKRIVRFRREIRFVELQDGLGEHWRWI